MNEPLTLRPVAQPDGSTLYALDGGVPVRKKTPERRGDRPYAALIDSFFLTLALILKKPVPVSLGLPAAGRRIGKIPLRRRRRRARGELNLECSFK